MHDSMLRAAGAMDEVDAVIELTRLLHERPALAEAVSERFPDLLVDEAEDACPAERSLIEALARGAETTVISCDDEQGRAPCGAASAWAREAFSPAELTLEPSWRYGGDLIDAAHAVVAPAEARRGGRPGARRARRRGCASGAGSTSEPRPRPWRATSRPRSRPAT